jgi:hypothetical protein
MSARPPIGDAELAAQLRRRAGPEAQRAQSARAQFVLAVDTKIEAAPGPARRFPLPALASLAGVAVLAVVVAIVAVAFPRSTPGAPTPGAPTPAPSQASEQPPSTISFVGNPDFQLRLAAGDLEGHTFILSRGELIVEPRRGPFCPVTQDDLCYIGTLAGIGIDVHARPIATAPDDGQALDGESNWTSWKLPSAPEGIRSMVLSVHGGVVEYLGSGSAEEELVDGVGEIRAIDVESMPLEEARVVPAWLTGIMAPVSCAPSKPGTYVDGLPGRYCGGPSWLTEEALRVNPEGFTIPDGAVQVQSGAYLKFAEAPDAVDGSAEPRAGAYVVAKRLEGSGCATTPPCWQWEILGRLTIVNEEGPVGPIATPEPTSDSSPEPSTSEPRTFECSGPPLPPETPPYQGHVPRVIDETGLVIGCVQTDVMPELEGRISVSNPFEPSAISVVWAGNSCDAEASFTFSRAADNTFDLVGQRPSTCAEESGSLPLYITFSQPVAADDVRATINGEPDPTFAPAVRCPSRGVFIELINWTNEPIECRVVPADELAAIPAGPRFTTDGDSSEVVRLTWQASSCVSATHIDVRDQNAYALIIHQEVANACVDVTANFGVDLVFGSRKVAGAFSAVIDNIMQTPAPTEPGPVATPAVPTSAPGGISCRNDGGDVVAVVYDRSGLVDSCEANDFSGDPPGKDPRVTNPDGDRTQLLVEYLGGACARTDIAVVPSSTGLDIQLITDASGPAVDATDPPRVCPSIGIFHAVQLTLASAVDAGFVSVSGEPYPLTSYDPIGCGATSAAVSDHTGLVVSCAEVAHQPPTGGIFEAFNPDGDTSRLVLTWVGQDPSACSPDRPAMIIRFVPGLAFGSFTASPVLSAAPSTGCFNVSRTYAVELTVRRPIAAEEVSFAAVGAGLTSTAKTEVGLFDLSIETDSASYASGQLVDVNAELHYRGGGDSEHLDVRGLAQLIHSFEIRQLDGPAFISHPIPEPCGAFSLDAGVPVRTAYPDPALSLPAGTWVVTARSQFWLGGDCGVDQVSLAASTVIVVR